MEIEQNNLTMCRYIIKTSCLQSGKLHSSIVNYSYVLINTGYADCGEQWKSTYKHKRYRKVIDLEPMIENIYKEVKIN